MVLRTEVQRAAANKFVDLGHVEPGQPADVRISSYDFSRFGAVSGTVRQISATTFVDEQLMPYYRAVIALDQDFVGDVAGMNPIIPGMTADVDIEWAGSSRRVTSQGAASDLRISVRGLEHWFAVGGELPVDGGSVDLKDLLDAVGQNRDFVRVDDDTWMRISDQLRGELGEGSFKNRSETIDEQYPLSVDPFRGLHQLGCPRAQHPRRGSRSERGIALLEHLQIRTQGRQVLGFHVKHSPVQPLPPYLRPGKHQLPHVRQHQLHR